MTTETQKTDIICGMKKKLLFIHHGSGIGGAPISLSLLIKSLNKENFEIFVLFLQQSEAVHLFENLNVHILTPNDFFLSKFYRYFVHYETNYIKWYNIPTLLRSIFSWISAAYFYAPRIIQSINPDLVYLNSSTLIDWAVAAKSFKYKVVMHLRENFKHGKFDFKYLLIRALINKYCDRIISISEFNLNKLSPSENSCVVYNHVEKVKPVEINYELSTNPNEILFLYVGGFSRIKGFVTLVHALPYLDKSVKIVFAGYYPKKNSKKKNIKHILNSIFRGKREMRSALVKMRTSDRAVDFGLSKNMAKLYQSVDAVITPFDIDHFPRPVIESFAARKIVLASDLDSCKEIIREGKNGFLFKAGDPVSLANAINRLKDNIEGLNDIVNEARKDAEEKFSKNNIIKIEQVINGII